MNISFFQLIILILFCFILFGDLSKIETNISKLKEKFLKFKNKQEK